LVVLVLPLRTRRVLRIALRDHIQAVGQIADHAGRYLAGEGNHGTLHADARAVDASYQALVATAQPLLPIRDLKLIDGAMARTAEVMGLNIADYDTSDGAPVITAPGSALIRKQGAEQARAAG
jgi:hypothetical protein